MFRRCAFFEKLKVRMLAADVVQPGRVETYAEVMIKHRELGQFFAEWQSLADYRARADEVQLFTRQIEKLRTDNEISPVAARKIYQNIEQWCSYLPRHTAAAILRAAPKPVKWWQHLFRLQPAT